MLSRQKIYHFLFWLLPLFAERFWGGVIFVCKIYFFAELLGDIFYWYCQQNQFNIINIYFIKLDISTSLALRSIWRERKHYLFILSTYWNKCKAFISIILRVQSNSYLPVILSVVEESSLIPKAIRINKKSDRNRNAMKISRLVGIKEQSRLQILQLHLFNVIASP